MNFSPNQLDCGMGTFTLLDAHGPTGRGLARLSTAEGVRYNPAVAGAAETFVDEGSAPGSRLFGQGAQLRVGGYSVFYR